MKNIIVLHTTVAKIEDAEKIAQTLLSLKLIACAQVDGPIKSIYKWKNKIESEQEYRLSVKSTDNLANEVMEKIQALHPYEIAEIVGQPLTHCSEEYKNWVANEVTHV